ncbi:MAG: hypothetical protein QNK37_14220 [Acidobacteriota bacterium]|nr:hypothetical protein [Acidobacteriota bacterium]
MFEPGSRYYALETAVHEGPDGPVQYKKRRFIPRNVNRQVLGEVRMGQSERLDLIAAKAYGNPTLYWQLCDSNRIMNPFDVQDEPGSVIQVTTPA